MDAKPVRVHAEATITVESSTTELFDQAEGPALAMLCLEEVFEGDIEARSTVRALQAKAGEGAARLVSLQRVCGSLCGREGTFVLQGDEIVEDGRIRATWVVSPGSGTGELTGLRGEGGFTGRFGEGSRGVLDFWFE